MGRDVSKLKAKGGGQWKYMSEKDMLDISAKFAPYRYVPSSYPCSIGGIPVFLQALISIYAPPFRLSMCTRIILKRRV